MAPSKSLEVWSAIAAPEASGPMLPEYFHAASGDWRCHETVIKNPGPPLHNSREEGGPAWNPKS
jgi:hypothetical protein